MLADERAKLKEGVYPARGDVPEPAAGGRAALRDQDPIGTVKEVVQVWLRPRARLLGFPGP